MHPELLIATRNKKKFKEIKDILKAGKAKRSLEIISLERFPVLPPVRENGRTFKANAVKKAVKIAALTGVLTLGEDSGLCVPVLGGAPGVYSSRFAGKDKSDDKNNRKLLKLLNGLSFKKRRAYYVCAAALADKHGLVEVVEGRCWGRIGFAPIGTYGFGYDPLFIIPEYKKTFAELGPKIKHRMSHRYQALKKIKKVLQRYAER